jgi:hypothetical protein
MKTIAVIVKTSKVPFFFCSLMYVVVLQQQWSITDVAPTLPSTCWLGITLVTTTITTTTTYIINVTSRKYKCRIQHEPTSRWSEDRHPTIKSMPTLFVRCGVPNVSSCDVFATVILLFVCLFDLSFMFMCMLLLLLLGSVQLCTAWTGARDTSTVRCFVVIQTALLKRIYMQICFSLQQARMCAHLVERHGNARVLPPHEDALLAVESSNDVILFTLFVVVCCKTFRW